MRSPAAALLRTVLWALGLGALAFAASWVFYAPDKTLRGTWRTVGYGQILDIGRITIDVWQVTESTCQHTMRLPAHLGLVRWLQGADLDAVGDRLTLQMDAALQPIPATRIAALPDRCDPPVPGPDATAAATYNVMWEAMAEHYPFFDLHGVDWAARRALAPADNGDQTLWQAMTTALDGLDDGHVFLSDGTKVFSPSVRPAWFADRHAIRDTTRAAIPGGLTRVDRTGLESGFAAPGIGYIYMAHMGVEAGIGGDRARIAAEAFAEIAANLQQARAIIIDLRYNPGGSDDIAMTYAGFFVSETQPAFSKMTVTPDGPGTPTNVTLRPTASRHLDQPVILLTSGFTASAAEIFTLALRDLPHVTTMGEPTAGNLSDVLEFNLPNGWTLGLSHQIYTAPDGEIYEGRGLPPDVPVTVAPAPFGAGSDPILGRAIATLTDG